MPFHFIFVTNFIRDKNPLYGTWNYMKLIFQVSPTFTEKCYIFDISINHGMIVRVCVCVCVCVCMCDGMFVT